MASQVEESLKLSNNTRQDYSGRMTELYREHSNLQQEVSRLIESSKSELREEITAIEGQFDELQKKFIGLKISLKEQIQEEVKEIREINKANETEIESILDQF